MGIITRIKRLWQLSEYHIMIGKANGDVYIASNIQKPQTAKEYAEFIMPSRVQEILKDKPDASIDDVLI